MYRYVCKNKVQSGKSRASTPAANKGHAQKEMGIPIQTKSLFSSSFNQENSEENMDSNYVPQKRLTSVRSYSPLQTQLAPEQEQREIQPVPLSYGGEQKKLEPASIEPNDTGIPLPIKENFESLSGFSFSDVKVHYNSNKPAQLQALAYTQGNQVYIGPGQEKHLEHELGHVVQQKGGFVHPTATINGEVPLNDSPELEAMADNLAAGVGNLPIGNGQAVDVIQRKGAIPLAKLYEMNKGVKPNSAITDITTPYDSIIDDKTTLESYTQSLEHQLATLQAIIGNASADPMVKAIAKGEQYTVTQQKKKAARILILDKLNAGLPETVDLSTDKRLNQNLAGLGITPVLKTTAEADYQSDIDGLNTKCNQMRLELRQHTVIGELREKSTKLEKAANDYFEKRGKGEDVIAEKTILAQYEIDTESDDAALSQAVAQKLYVMAAQIIKIEGESKQQIKMLEDQKKELEFMRDGLKGLNEDGEYGAQKFKTFAENVKASVVQPETTPIHTDPAAEAFIHMEKGKRWQANDKFAQRVKQIETKKETDSALLEGREPVVVAAKRTTAKEMSALHLEAINKALVVAKQDGADEERMLNELEERFVVALRSRTKLTHYSTSGEISLLMSQHYGESSQIRLATNNSNKQEEKDLQNTGFVFFFMEDMAGFKPGRYGDNQYMISTADALERGLLDKGWIMLSDMLTGWSSFSEANSPGGKSIKLGTDDIGKMSFKKGSGETVGDMTFTPVGGEPARPALKFEHENNILTGKDIIPGLARRAVQLTWQFKAVNKVHANTNQDQLVKYILSLFRIQVMLPGGVVPKSVKKGAASDPANIF